MDIGSIINKIIGTATDFGSALKDLKSLSAFNLPEDIFEDALPSTLPAVSASPPISPDLQQILDKDKAEREQFISELKTVTASFPHYSIRHVRGTKTVHYCYDQNGVTFKLCNVVGLSERPLSIEEIESKRKVPCRDCHKKALSELKSILKSELKAELAVQPKNALRKLSPAQNVAITQSVVSLVPKTKRKTDKFSKKTLETFAELIKDKITEHHNIGYSRDQLMFMTGLNVVQITRTLKYMRRHGQLNTNDKRNQNCIYYLPQVGIFQHS